MKRMFLALLLCISAVVTFGQTSHTITREQAAKVAARYMPAGQQPQLVQNGPRRAASTGNAPLYIFSRGVGQGFVIVSGDDSMPAVLGVVESGDYDETTMVPALVDMINGWSEIIIANQTAGAPSMAPRKAPYHNADIAPMITTHWSQNAPYNLKCPVGAGTSAHAMTGCVPTAMAQVVYYWYKKGLTDGTAYLPATVRQTTEKYNNASAPITDDYVIAAGTAYNWADMTNTYDGSSTDASKNAVATLMATIGLGAKVVYRTSSTSGALVSTIPVLRDQFSLRSESFTRGETADAVWAAKLIGQLSQGRPVAYGGVGSMGGHAFVCDGYRQSDNMFHFNFGWGGTSDGYFAVTNAAGACGGFWQSQQILTVCPESIAGAGDFTTTFTTTPFVYGQPSTITVTVTNNQDPNDWNSTNLDHLYVLLSPYEPDYASQFTTRLENEDFKGVSPGESATQTFTFTPAYHTTYNVKVLDGQNRLLYSGTIQMAGDKPSGAPDLPAFRPYILTNLDDITDGHIYTLTANSVAANNPNRGYLSNNSGTLQGATYSAGATSQQFAIVKTGNGYYLWNVQARKFVPANSTYVVGTMNFVNTPCGMLEFENAVVYPDNWRIKRSGQAQYIQANTDKGVYLAELNNSAMYDAEWFIEAVGELSSADLTAMQNAITEYEDTPLYYGVIDLYRDRGTFYSNADYADGAFTGTGVAGTAASGGYKAWKLNMTSGMTDANGVDITQDLSGLNLRIVSESNNAGIGELINSSAAKYLYNSQTNGFAPLEVASTTSENNFFIRVDPGYYIMRYDMKVIPSQSANTSTFTPDGGDPVTTGNPGGSNDAIGWDCHATPLASETFFKVKANNSATTTGIKLFQVRIANEAYMRVWNEYTALRALALKRLPSTETTVFVEFPAADQIQGLLSQLQSKMLSGVSEPKVQDFHLKRAQGVFYSSADDSGTKTDGATNSGSYKSWWMGDIGLVSETLNDGLRTAISNYQYGNTAEGSGTYTSEHWCLNTFGARNTGNIYKLKSGDAYIVGYQVGIRAWTTGNVQTLSDGDGWSVSSSTGGGCPEVLSAEKLLTTPVNEVTFTQTAGAAISGANATACYSTFKVKLINQAYKDKWEVTFKPLWDEAKAALGDGVGTTDEFIALSNAVANLYPEDIDVAVATLAAALADFRDTMGEYTYNIVDANDEQVASITLSLAYGDALPDITSEMDVYRPFVSYDYSNRPTGNFTKAMKGKSCTIRFTEAADAPFHASTFTDGEYGTDVHWYKMTLYGLSSECRYASDARVQTANAANTNTNTVGRFFCFTGDQYRGFKIHAYALPPNFTFGGAAHNDNQDMFFSASHEDVFVALPNDTGFALQNKDYPGSYLNKRDNYWRYWNDDRATSDAGSRFVVTEASAADIAAAVTAVQPEIEHLYAIATAHTTGYPVDYSALTTAKTTGVVYKFFAAWRAYTSAAPAVAVNMPKAGVYYYIRNGKEAFTTAGKRNSMYSNGNNLSWKLEEATNANFIWRFVDKGNGTYAIQNVGTDKYVNNTADDNNAAIMLSDTEPSAAVPLTHAGALQFRLWSNVSGRGFHAAGHNGNSGNVIGYTSDGMANTPNGWYLDEAPYGHYTYNLKANGSDEVIGSVKLLLRDGDTMPDIVAGNVCASLYSEFATYDYSQRPATYNVATMMGGSCTITYSVSGLPFQISNIETGDMHWYTMTLNSKSMSSRLEGEMTSTQVYREFETPLHNYYAFTGNPIHGFEIVNYMAGPNKVLGSTSIAGATMPMFMTKGEDVKSRHTVKGVNLANRSFVLFNNALANAKLNDYAGNGTAKYWVNAGTGDAGSTFVVTEVSASDMSAAVTAMLADWNSVETMSSQLGHPRDWSVVRDLSATATDWQKVQALVSYKMQTDLNTPVDGTVCAVYYIFIDSNGNRKKIYARLNSAQTGVAATDVAPTDAGDEESLYYWMVAPGTEDDEYFFVNVGNNSYSLFNANNANLVASTDQTALTLKPETGITSGNGARLPEAWCICQTGGTADGRSVINIDNGNYVFNRYSSASAGYMNVNGTSSMVYLEEINADNLPVPVDALTDITAAYANAGKVGYPANYETFKQAYEDYMAITKPHMADFVLLQAAYNPYAANTTDVIMPADGHAYKMGIMNASDGSLEYLKFDEDSDGNKFLSHTANASEATVFVSRKVKRANGTDNGYMFVDSDYNGYLLWRGGGGANSDKGFYAYETSNYSATDCALRLVPGQQPDGGANVNKGPLGTFHVYGYRNTTSGYESAFSFAYSSNAVSGWACAGSTNSYYNANYSSALKFEEVEYTANEVEFKSAAVIEDVGYLATFSFPARMALPEGVKAYWAEPKMVQSKKMIHMTEVKGAIEAGAGVVLVAENPDKLRMLPAAGEVADNRLSLEQDGIPVNKLKGTADGTEDIASTRTNVYILTAAKPVGQSSAIVGFFNLNSSTNRTIASYKAYLEVSDDYKTTFSTPTGTRKMVNLSWGDISGEATGVDAVTVEWTADGAYDLSGRRVGEPAKGLYIVNGKKVMIK